MRSIYFAVVATYAWGNLIHYEEIRKHTRMAKITPNDFHDETKYRGFPGFRDFKIWDLVFPSSFFYFAVLLRHVFSLFYRYCSFASFLFCNGYFGFRKILMAKITPNDFHDKTKYRGIPRFCDFKIRYTIFPASFYFRDIIFPWIVVATSTYVFLKVQFVCRKFRII